METFCFTDENTLFHPIKQSVSKIGTTMKQSHLSIVDDI